MISIRIYRQGKETLVSACDKELIGKKFVEGKLQIDASEKFYGGETKDVKVLEKLLTEATMANLVGKEVVLYAIKLGFINKDCVLTIKGIPHAQMYKMF